MGQAAVKFSGVSEYPEAMNNYFKSYPINIKPFPDMFVKIKEEGVTTIQITTAKQYYEFLNTELQFWNVDKDKRIGILKCNAKLQAALNYFDNAKNYFLRNDVYYGNQNLQQSISQINKDYLCSETKLAKFLSEIKDKNIDFFHGFSCALQENVSLNLPYFKSGFIEGYYEGLIYSGEVKRVSVLIKKTAANFTENVKEADENYKKLNEQFSDTLYANEKRISEIQTLTDREINNLKIQTEEFFKEKEQRSQELENLYENKLRLEKPAEYWEQMALNYSKQGKRWLIASCVIAVAIIAMLVLIIAFVPNLFDKNSHWFDIVKNSAIITIITSIAIYLLRVFVKMTMSSLHLSRDAKEREQLSYFYLALLERKGVTDKERALVINSLFSRSDTGLLKGDSTPVMTANVGEIIDRFTKSINN